MGDKFTRRGYSGYFEYLQERRYRLEEAMIKAEEKYYAKENAFLRAIRKGDLDAVKSYLENREWDGKEDCRIHYREDMSFGYGKKWREYDTTLLFEAIIAEQIPIISYVVASPEFKVSKSNRGLLIGAGNLASKYKDKALLKRIQELLLSDKENALSSLQKMKNQGR